MNINDFMNKRTFKKLIHNKKYETTFHSFSHKETKNGFMLAFNFLFEENRVESHYAHYSRRMVKVATEDGTIEEQERENDQITPFMKRLLDNAPKQVQKELNGLQNIEILDYLVQNQVKFNIYPIFSEYEANGISYNNRDFWFEPKQEFDEPATSTEPNTARKSF